MERLAHIAIIGIGGTGNFVLRELADHKEFRITIVDGDIIEKNNLDRQILFSEEDCGKLKVAVAKQKIGREDIETVAEFFDGSQHLDANIIIDCTDNMSARKRIDAYCKKKNIPWIHTAAVGDFGTILFVDLKTDISTLLLDKQGTACGEFGVRVETVQMVGDIAARCAVQFLTTNTCEKDLLRMNSRSKKVSTYKLISSSI